MNHLLLEAWSGIDNADSSIMERIADEKAKRPWFCLPHMLEAKLSGDADDLMRASMYAPDRARMHEWTDEKALDINRPQQRPASPARPFSLMAFHPPASANGGGTGALDTKVQIIVSQHFSISEKIKSLLHTSKKSATPSSKTNPPKQAKVDSETKPRVQSQSGAIVYHSQEGRHIPISISEEQRALFNEEKSLVEKQEQPSGDPLEGFKLRPVDELENVKPDDSVKTSIEQKGLPLSETMAKLLAGQGNTKDAISIYEQLILANPEKNAYFTAQIEKIKQA